MKYEIPQMLKSGGGSIVNTASGAGLVGVEQLSAYNASKHGVVGLTKTAALEFAQKNIRVNCVCPGLINTPMVARMIDSGGMNEQEFLAAEPVGRMGRPEEIGEGVVWLLSDAGVVRDRSRLVDRRRLCRPVVAVRRSSAGSLTGLPPRTWWESALKCRPRRILSASARERDEFEPSASLKRAARKDISATLRKRKGGQNACTIL
jgi:hypothetical protein